MNLCFSVGEMAKLSGLSKQTLIYYDREGVFTPKIVNPENGYRYYTPDQLEELDSILILRETGLSLKEIKAHRKHRSRSSTVEVLTAQKEEVQQKIAHWQAVEKRLEHKIASIEEFAGSSNTETVFVECGKEYLFAQKPDQPAGLLEVDIALKRLLRDASEHNLPFFYQIGNMVAEQNLKAGQFLQFSYVFLPLEKPIPGAQIKMLCKPAGLYAQTYHIGNYQTMGNTYQKLLASLTTAGYEIAGPSYEYCIFDCLTTQTSAEYATKIQIPIIKR